MTSYSEFYLEHCVSSLLIIPEKEIISLDSYALNDNMTDLSKMTFPFCITFVHIYMHKLQLESYIRKVKY